MTAASSASAARRSAKRCCSAGRRRSPGSSPIRRRWPTTVDWVAKHRAARRVPASATASAWDDARLAAMDLQYHDLRPEKSLAAPCRAGADRRRRRDRVGDDAAPARHARLLPRHAACSAGPTSIVAANWDSLVFDVGGDPLRRVPMMEPLRGTEAHVGSLIDGCDDRRRSPPAARAMSDEDNAMAEREQKKKQAPTKSDEVVEEVPATVRDRREDQGRARRSPRRDRRGPRGQRRGVRQELRPEGRRVGAESLVRPCHRQAVGSAHFPNPRDGRGDGQAVSDLWRVQPLATFHRATGMRDGHRNECRAAFVRSPCAVRQTRRRRSRRQAMAAGEPRAPQRLPAKRNADPAVKRRREMDYRRTYGITPTQFDEMSCAKAGGARSAATRRRRPRCTSTTTTSRATSAGCSASCCNRASASSATTRRSLRRRGGLPRAARRTRAGGPAR